jgi:hypothetical protein
VREFVPLLVERFAANELDRLRLSSVVSQDVTA